MKAEPDRGEISEEILTAATGFRAAAIVLLLLCATSTPTAAEDPAGLPFLTDHSPVVGEEETWSIAQDKDGVIYLATGSGVVEYDGTSSRLVPLANGSIARSLAVHESGQVFVGGIGEVGVLTRDATGWLSYSPLHDSGGRHLEGLRDVWFMWPTEKGFLAWTLDRVLAWDGQAFSSWPLDRRTMPGRVSGRLVMVDPEGRLQVLADGELGEAGRLIGLGGERVRTWLPRSDGSSLLGTAEGHLWNLSREDVRAVLGDSRAELRPSRLLTEADPILEKHHLYQGTSLGDGKIALATMAGGAVVLEADGRLLHP